MVGFEFGPFSVADDFLGFFFGCCAFKRASTAASLSSLCLSRAELVSVGSCTGSGSAFSLFFLILFVFDTFEAFSFVDPSLFP